MRNIGRIIIFSVSCFILLARASQANASTDVTSDISFSTTWTKEGSPYIIKKAGFGVSAKLTIEPGTVVKLYSPAHRMNIAKDISVRGTAQEPIIFTSYHDDTAGGDSDGSDTAPDRSDWDKISINPSVKAEFNHVIIRYAKNGINSVTTSSDYKNLTIRNSEISECITGVYMENLEPVIENNVFLGNNVAIIFFANHGLGRELSLSWNSFSGNGYGVYAYNTDNVGVPCADARNNWWGDSSGPYDLDGNPDGKGDAVQIDHVLYDPWLGKDPNDGPDPVIIIPGIMGSWEKNGVWTIDPIFHTYDNLCEEFLANGYENGKNFFVFPYEWRDSNVENAKLLDDLIDDIKEQSHRSSVDIVAHSMGGLLAREYIESDYYDDDVDQLITIGTPHLGAPKDYIKWEAGEFFGDVFERAGRSLFYLEAIKNGYTGIFAYIHAKIPSVQELLPVYNYLYDENGEDYILRESYPINYPGNKFLEDLNETSKIKRLENIDFTKIIGETESETSTVSGYNVVNGNMQDLWLDGYPKYFDIPVLNRQGIRKGKGDGTVPTDSAKAENIPASDTIVFPSEHGNLPADAQKAILEILTGKTPENEISQWHVPDLLLLLVHSPIDIQIKDEFGNTTGKNAETGEIFENISGSFYGAESKEICPDDPEKFCNIRPEFITIPNPDGEYTISAQGTGNGEYTIEVVRITQDESDPDNSKEAVVPIKGTAEDGVTQEAEIEVTETEVIYNPDTDPPVIMITSPENEKGYLDDNHALEFSSNIADEPAGVDESTIEKTLNGEVFENNTLDLSLVSLGSYEYKVSASDKAGNHNSASVIFQNTTNLGAIQNNIDHYFNLGLIKKKMAKRYLTVKLRHLENLFNLLEKIENSKLKPKPKKAATDALKKIINSEIDRLVRRINRRTPRWYDQNTSSLLTESLEYLKIN